MAENTAKFTIDVTPVYCGEKKSIEFSYELPPESVAVGNDISFLTPVTASGSITETVSGNGDSEGYVELALTVSTKIGTHCARCLDDVESDYTITAKYGVTPFLQNAEENETCIMTDEGLLDIASVARTLFLLNLPSRFLCSEDCKGICQGCGANLNREPCTCTEKEVDPRLSALKNFFKG